MSKTWEIQDGQSKEAVVTHDGVEIDWYDPIVSIIEDDECWYIDNGYQQYRVAKKNGLCLEVREMT